ncbi:MAG TPA: hypothetical protein H9684_04605 [Firmicutes bacterium]|nr:hypothetical protein [Bacillota bacterium]
MADKRDLTIKKRKPAGREADGAETVGETPAAGLHALPPRRKRRRGRSVLRLVFRLALVAALVAGIFLVYKNWDSIAPESLVIWLEEKLSGGQAGDGFPVELSGSEVLEMAESRDGLALLSDTAYIVYNSSGGEVLRRPHGFSSPVMKTAGKWTLIAEAGGTRLRLETRSSTALEMAMENKIVSAAVAENGSFAVCTESSQGFTSEIVVYSSKEKLLFRWQGVDRTVLDVALSADGAYLAAVGVTAQDGALKSSLLLFDLGKKDPVAQVDDTGAMLCAVGFFSNGAVAAVGDTGLWVVGRDGSIQQKTDYGSRELVGFAVGEKNAAVVLQDYGGTEGGELLVVNPNGDTAYTLPFEGTYRHIAPTESGAVLLTSAHLYKTGAQGLEETMEAPRDGRLVSTLGHKVLVLGLTALSEVS